MTAPRPILVLAVAVSSPHVARSLYPPCLRHGTTVPLPYADPPRWALPGGGTVDRQVARVLARRLGWAMQEKDTP
jgi:hypothetical protein